MSKNNSKIVYLYLLVTFSAWGSLYVMSKFVLGNVPTFTALFIRFAIAGLVLSVILKKRGAMKIRKEDYKYIFLIGFFGYFISLGAQFIGTKLTNASLASLINSMNPITITIFASILLKEKITLRNIISIIIVLIGVRILLGSISSNIYIGGILVSLFSIVLWSLVSVLIKKLSKRYDSFQITVYGIIMGAIFTFPIAVYEIMTTSIIKIDIVVIAALIYMGLVCTALAHVLWNKSLSILDASRCSLFYPIQPLVATLLGILFLNERINKNFVLGAILIVGSVIFNIVGGTKQKQNDIS